MHRLSPETFDRFKVKRTVVLWRISTLRRRFGSFCHRFLVCWMLNSSAKYRPSPAVVPSSPPTPATDLADVVALKISLFGDSRIGKTSFLTKYAGGGGGERSGENEPAMTGIKPVDKTLDVQGARICYSIWEVGGDRASHDQIPAACKDSVAMLFMFDLTSRCTLKNVIRWYQEARKWNQCAIPVLIGTKFDDFIQLPLHLQWTIAKQHISEEERRRNISSVTARC